MNDSDTKIMNAINAIITPHTGGNSRGANGGIAVFEQVLGALGNPHQNIPPVVHVAGTNGKGSVIAFIKSIMEQSGYAVHTTTSPHLVYINERIVLAGKPIANEVFLDYINRVAQAVDTVGEPMGFFDVVTACAFLAFAEHPADIVLLETGIGGRCDVTNVIPNPAVTVITPIGHDHADILGNTIAQIATEKAHIQKPNCPSIIAPQPETGVLDAVLKYADSIHAKPYVGGQGWGFEPTPCGGFEFLNIQFPKPALDGTHQITNASTAVATAMVLGGEGFTKITPATMQNGIQNATWYGRMQCLTQGEIFNILPNTTPVWLDGGHNQSAGTAIADHMQKNATLDTKPIAIIAMGHAKDCQKFLAQIAPHITHLYAIPVPAHDRIMPPEQLAQYATEQGIQTTVCNSLNTALESIAQTYPNAPLYIIGSLYLAGYILQDNA